MQQHFQAHIDNLQDFCQLLVVYGIKRQDVQYFIEKFIEERNKLNPSVIITPMNPRVMRRTNNREKNIIMCRCGHLYPNQFYDSFVTFINEKYQFSKEKKQELFKRLRSTIDAQVRPNEEIMPNESHEN